MINKQTSKELRETNKFLKIFLPVLASFCIIIGLVLTLKLFISEPELKIKSDVALNVQTNDNVSSYFDRNSQIGTFVSGIAGTLFSLAGVFLLFLNLRDQNESSERDKIEGRFFELVKLHRENIQELVYRGQGNEVLITGRKVFKEVYEQIKLALALSERLLNIYNVKICVNQVIISRIPEDELRDYSKIYLAYTIVFFGVSKDDDNATKIGLKKVFNEEFVELFYGFFRLVPAKYSLKKNVENWDECLSKNVFSDELIRAAIIPYNGQNSNDFLKIATVFKNNSCLFGIHKLKDFFYKRFGGHQHKLGHYFRHLYQTVTYIDNQKLLSYPEKYEYIKTLRAQLSNYEQMVFFYNSFHYLGREWELAHGNEYEKFLISKYNFIKNIPDVTANGFDIKKYYPLIDFEFEEASKLRKKILEEYWA